MLEVQQRLWSRERSRDRRRKNAGKSNKAKRRNQGTTPVFPIHTPEIDARFPEQATQASDGSES